MSISIKRSILTIMSVSIIVKILGLIYRLIISRTLGFEGMKTYSLLSPILSLSLTLSSLSIPGVVNRHVSYNINKKSYSNRPLIQEAMRITIISTLSITLFLIILARILSVYVYKNPILEYPILLLFPIIFFSNLSAILKGYLEAHNYFKIGQIANLIEQIVKILLCICIMIFLKNISLKFMIIIIVVTLSLCEISSFTYLIIKIKKITPLTLTNKTYPKSKILCEALPLTITQIIGSIYSFIEPIILHNILGDDTGIIYYTLVHSYSIPLLLMAYFVSHGINKAIYPKMCSVNKDNPLLFNYINKALFLSIITSIININLCYFHPDLLLKIMYGNTLAKNIVKKMSLFYFFIYFEPIFISILQSQGLQKYILYINIFTHIILLILFPLLTYYIGPIGYIISNIIFEYLTLFLCFLVIIIKLKYKFKLKKFLLIILLLSLNILMGYIFNKSLKLSILLPNITSILILYLYYRFSIINNSKPSEEA